VASRCGLETGVDGKRAFHIRNAETKASWANPIYVSHFAQTLENNTPGAEYPIMRQSLSRQWVTKIPTSGPYRARIWMPGPHPQWLSGAFPQLFALRASVIGLSCASPDVSLRPAGASPVPKSLKSLETRGVD
jgi:hypothetical protein